MTIAVMSDLHDNVAAWQSILKILASRSILTLVNCGDTCSPAMLQSMATSFPGEIHTVFGNVADRDLELEVVKTLPNVTHYGDSGTVQLDNKKIFVNHYPAAAETVAQRGEVELACHGHTHLKRWEKIGATMVLNPGTAGGMFQYPSVAIVDLDTMNCSFIEITV
jgi:putative phosphoesterase